MHFTQIKYSNIKGTSGEYSLTPLTIVSGSNGSGKSAFLESLRLAAKGTCSLGASRQNIAKMVSGTCANVQLSSPEHVVDWHMSIGDTIQLSYSGNPPMEGVPITVDELWSLTGEQKLALVGAGAKHAIETLDTQIANAKAQLKDLKAAIDAPQPAAPPPYSGEPREVVEQRVLELSGVLANAKGVAATREEVLAKAKELRDNEARAVALLCEVEQEAANKKSKMEMLKSIADKCRAENAKLPSLARKYRTLDVLAADVCDTLVWMGFETEADAVRSVEWDGPVCGSADAMYDELDASLQACAKDAQTLNNTLEAIRFDLAKLEAPSNVADIPHVIALLSAEREKLRHAEEWDTFEQRTGQWAVKRAQMVEQYNKLEGELEKLIEDRANHVQRVKSGVENIANIMLARGGFKPLVINIASSGKRASMEVEVGGVNIQSLAASELLVYGICLLIAVQYTVECACPVLVAECAELDETMFNRLVQAIGRPENGSVILEHWMDVEGSIRMGDGDEPK